MHIVRMLRSRQNHDDAHTPASDCPKRLRDEYNKWWLPGSSGGRFHGERPRQLPGRHIAEPQLTTSAIKPRIGGGDRSTLGLSRGTPDGLGTFVALASQDKAAESGGLPEYVRLREFKVWASSRWINLIPRPSA